MKRRDFFKTAMIGAGGAALSAQKVFADTTGQPIDNRPVSSVNFPEKKPLIVYSDRPPLLETPREVFTQVFTPNDQFFVRWHMPDIPTHIDEKKFTVTVDGLVEKKLSITLDELKRDFEQVEVAAVLQCGGNSRSAFKPTAGGIQWGSGAMGCALWKGVRLRDILDKAGLKKNAKWLAVRGSEKAAYYETPEFIRELRLEDLDDHVIIAYSMNGEDLPYLNGFPVRLIIPGAYSDSWIKMLSQITVTDTYQKLFFMEHAYRVPDNACECETPQKRFAKTKPIHKMNVKSLIGWPLNGQKLTLKSHVTVRGVAWDGGSGIKEVQISTDGGKSWDKAILDDGKWGRYAYRTFRYTFKPTQLGKIRIMARATNKLGQSQPFAHEVKWNHGGYKFNGIDEVNVEIV